MYIPMSSFSGDKFISFITKVADSQVEFKYRSEDFVHFHNPSGRGICTYLKTGLTIALGEYNEKFEGMAFEFAGDDKETPYKIGFCSKGRFLIRYPKLNFEEEVKKGENIIFSPLFGSQFKLFPGEEVTLLYIFITRQFLNNYFNIKSDKLNTTIRKMNKSDFLFARGKNSPQMNLALNDILNIDEADLLSKILIESKTLELLSLFFQQFSTVQNKITKHDKDVILKIHHFLLTNPEKNITIRKISSQFGLNEHKLQAGFRILFGSTVKQHQRKLKLQKAKELILRKTCSVSEAGFKIGYTNLSHFSTAFKQEYGILPSEINQEKNSL